MNSALHALLDEYIKDFTDKKDEQFIVPHSVPVAWEGNSDKYFSSQIKIVTAALAPSPYEFPEAFDDGACKKFADKTLNADKLYVSLDRYFETNPNDLWFMHFEKCLNMLGAGYGGKMGEEQPNTAIHVNTFSAMATDPAFARLSLHQRNAIDQRKLFEKLLGILSPDIVLMSVNKEAFFETFGLYGAQTMFYERSKIEAYRTDSMIAVYGRNVKGTPFSVERDYLEAGFAEIKRALSEKPIVYMIQQYKGGIY